MSGVQRFLSRRGRNKDPRKPRPSQPTDHFDSVFTTEADPKAKHDKEEDRRVEGVLERLRNHNINNLVESNVRYALRATNNQGDGDAAFRMLVLLQTTVDGVVMPYEPNVKLLGAVNREMVTCYLDSLLFSMFARLDCFQAMLYDEYEDAPRKRLAGLLRLWTNMVRSGRLVTVDITKQIQEACAACGWQDAANLRQQDPSEAFTFITGKLNLPLLTLKMDLYHTGKEDPQDDHKFINERLLEVAILDKPLEGKQEITLEDCLENYFNNRIEVRRHLENQRRNTFKSGSSNTVQSPTKLEKESGIHVETVEISTADVSLSSTPIAETPSTALPNKNPLDKLRPSMSRHRADSIFSQRKVELTGIDPESPNTEVPPAPPERKPSMKTEVLMPAWQFFQLLPWYTDHIPTTDAQVAAHFSKQRPVLGICLKRYSYTSEGEATRLNTYIDIPLEIAVPNFVSDENLQDDGPLVGNFRLILQSVVCHRGGLSVHSGHYVSLNRMGSSTVPPLDLDSRRSSQSDDTLDPWVRFDDLAPERVSRVDIREALKKETPYLLFYQVQPIDEEGYPVHDLPSYAEATCRPASEAHSYDEKAMMDDAINTEAPLYQAQSNPFSNDNGHGLEANDQVVAAGRLSFDIPPAHDGMRGRSSMQYDGHRGSVAVDDTNIAGSVSGGSIRTDHTPSIPSTPNEEKNPGSFLGIASKIVRSRSTRMSRGSKDRSSNARPSSAGTAHDNSSRFSLNMTKLTKRVSRDESQPPPASRPDVSHNGSLTPEHIENSTVRSAEQPPSVVIDEPLRHGTVPAAIYPADPSSHLQVKKDKATARHEKRLRTRRGHNGEEDRECVIM